MLVYMVLSVAAMFMVMVCYYMIKEIKERLDYIHRRANLCVTVEEMTTWAKNRDVPISEVHDMFMLLRKRQDAPGEDTGEMPAPEAPTAA